MSNDEEQQRRSRVVVQTPTARREVERVETAYAPERSGLSTGMVAALVIGAVALVTILFLFLSNRQDDTTNSNVRTTTTTTQTQPSPAPPTTIIQQPAPAAQQPPVIIQQPAAPPPATTTQPIIIPGPATTTSSSSTTNKGATSTSKPSAPDDGTIETSINSKITNNQTLAPLGVTATVVNGKVTLMGTVERPELKRQFETLARSVTGVKGVDNQITVSGNANSIP